MSADPVNGLLNGLPEPEPPRGFERAVMTRIAQLADTRGRAGMRPRAALPERRVSAPAWIDIPAWAGSIVGLVVFFVSWVAGHLGTGGLTHIVTSPQAAAALLSSMPTSLPAIAGLSTGVALFVAGLFLPDNPHSPARQR